MNKKNISTPSLRRLPSYYNIVCQAADADQTYISSKSIASQLDIDDTQVRKDIAAIGYVGKPKVGFDVKDFKTHLEKFLGFEQEREAFIIGAGNLGIALARYDGFEQYGFKLKALFDNDPHKIGLKIANKQVFYINELEQFINENITQIAILTVPAEFAQQVTDNLINMGIKAIWNFAPISLKTPEDVKVWNQNLAGSLITFAQLL